MNTFMTSFTGDPEFCLKCLAATGALIAFAVGLLQYRRAQLWRRKEFLGNEVKAFLADGMIRNTRLMIDWSARRIPFDPATGRASWPKVTREIQVNALTPHVLRVPTRPSPTEEPRRYSELEANIRDSYDAFLDGLERFSAFVESGLFAAREVDPYLRYWFQNMSTPIGPSEDLRWRLALLAYIQFYEFRGVQTLLRPLVGDITVGGHVWQKLRASDPTLAEALEGACRGAV